MLKELTQYVKFIRYKLHAQHHVRPWVLVHPLERISGTRTYANTYVRRMVLYFLRTYIRPTARTTRTYLPTSTTVHGTLPATGSTGNIRLVPTTYATDHPTSTYSTGANSFIRLSHFDKPYGGSGTQRCCSIQTGSTRTRTHFSTGVQRYILYLGQF